MEQAVFEETQKFRQSSAAATVIFVSALAIFAVALGLTPRYGVGCGRPPVPFSTIFLFIPPVCAAGTIWLFICAKMETKVYRDCIFIKFFPFTERTIAFSQIVSCRALQYRPLMEYGGWGIRVRWNGIAYNVSGNQGVRLELSDGRHVLIGTQRPQELEGAINTGLRSKMN